MVVRIEAPDGSIAEFPDGTPDAKIKAAMRKQFGGPTNVGKDVALGGASGLLKGAAATLPMVAGGVAPAQLNPFNPTKRLDPMGQAIANPIQTAATMARMMGQGKVADLLGNAASGVYKPQTTPGKYASTTAEMVPNLLFSKGGLLRQATSVIAPGVLSEAGGQMAEGTVMEGPARVIGAMAGGGLSGVRRGPKPQALYATDAPRKVADKAGAYVAKKVPSKALAKITGPKHRMAAEATPQGTVALQTLVRRPGATEDKVLGEVFNRRSEMPTRILDDFAEASGMDPAAAKGDFQALAKAGRVKASPLYEEAYAVGAIDTPVLRGLSQRPSMRAALARARRIAAEEGRDPAELGFELRSTQGPRPSIPVTVTERIPGGGTRDRTVMQAGPAQTQDELVAIQNPTAQTWDYVKRGLDDVLNTYRDKTTGKLQLDEEGRAILATLDDFRAEVIQANPAYGKALQAGGDPLRLEEAFRRGEEMLTNTKVTTADVAEYFAKLGEADQQAFRGGMANRVFNMAQNAQLGPKALSAPNVQGKIAVAMGQQAGGKFASGLDAETQMLNFDRRVAPGAGSPTMPLLEAAREQDAALSGGLLSDYAQNAVQGKGVLGSASATAGQRLQGLLDNMRTNRSEPVRDEAGKLLTMPPDELAAIVKQIEQQTGMPLQRLLPQLQQMGLSGLLAN